MPWGDPETDIVLGSVADVAGYQAMLGVTLTTDQQAQATLHIQAAIEYVQMVTEQDLDFVDADVVTFDSPGGRWLYLPQLPVVDVSAVTVNGDVWIEDTDWDWSQKLGAVYSRCHHWPRGRQNIDVTYSHGYQQMPLNLQRLIYSIAARAIDALDGQMVTSETLGQYSATYEQLIGGLTQMESDQLERLRQPNGVAA